ncbi:hypothetical protein FsymDg_1757 [Candidatus Protofrankia datiscae]|uniref:Uncharacterized protein n=1 Tax=Candidatus Protofrankia datiscae TaxID=2716812 RepID=F8B5M9_9ACTN|nr:hypothetical protein FsymDg_1757 [Candidatus Protofrankia datiscae]
MAGSLSWAHPAAGNAANGPGKAGPPDGGAEPGFLWGAPVGARPGETGGGPAGYTGGTGTTAGDPAHAGERLVGLLGGLLVLVAGATAIVGSVMTWATITAFDIMELPLRGTEAGRYYGGTTALLGVLAVVLGGMLTGRDRNGWRWILTAAIGLTIILVAVIDMIRLLRVDQLGGIELDLSVELGPGLWITLLSGLFTVTGALLARFLPVRPREGRGGPGGPGGRDS